MEAALTFVTVQQERIEQSARGTVRLVPQGAVIEFAAQDYRMRIAVRDGGADVVKSGNGGYRLALQAGETTLLAADDWQIPIHTKKVKYKQSDGQLLFWAEYALGDEANATQLILRADF